MTNKFKNKIMKKMGSKSFRNLKDAAEERLQLEKRFDKVTLTTKSYGGGVIDFNLTYYKKKNK
jgi:hypothetical protein